MRNLRPTLPLLALLLPACMNSPRFVDSPAFPKTTTEVVGTVIEILERQGFRVQAINEGKEVEAVQIRLSPFNKQGTRRSAAAKVDTVPEGTIVRLMVEKEINSNITNPLDEAQADWGSREFDLETEDLLLSLIGLKVMPPRIPAGTPVRKRD